MKQKLIELPIQNGSIDEGSNSIDMSQEKSFNNNEYDKQIYESGDSESNINQQNGETLILTSKNDSISSKRKTQDGTNGEELKKNGQNTKRFDKLKLKIVCIILISLIFGIIFTGVMNYFLAILLSDHISETTTQEIGKVQIDFTRSMGLHYGNAYVNLIQQESDKTQKVYKMLWSIFNEKTIQGDFTQVTKYFNAPSAGTTINECDETNTIDKDTMLWKLYGIPTIQDIANLSTLHQNVLKKVLSLYGVLRAVKSDIDLKTVNIILFDQQLLVTYPAKKLSSESFVKNQNLAMLAHQKSKEYYSTRQNRFYFNYQQDTISCNPLPIIIVTDCIAIVCEDLKLDKIEPCLSNPSDLSCNVQPADFCGSICTFYIKYTLSFLKSLEGKGINSVYVSQVSDKMTENDIYTPLVFLDFKNFVVSQNFWQQQFGVSKYSDSSEAQQFYNKFDRYYKKVDRDYLATSSFTKGDDDFQISIFSIKQKFDTLIQNHSTAKSTMAFTAITKIPKSKEIFQSTITDIKSSMDQLLIIGIVVLVILSVMITCYIYRYSDHVTQPINLLQERVKQIAEGNLDVNVQNDTNKHWQEIDTLFKNFEFLNQIVVSSDDKYYSDLTAESLIKYSNAFVMFEKLDNRKGMGIVLNNMGNINMKLGRIEEAINCYKQSFQLAERDLLELLLVDNIFAYYNVKPFNGWDSIKKYDFTYNYHFYSKMLNRPKFLLVCTANKGLYQTIIANRAYQLARAYHQGYIQSSNFETRQEYLNNCIDYFSLTEKLDQIQNKSMSRTIFTKLQLCQALIQKAEYFYQQNDMERHEQMRVQSVYSMGQAEAQLGDYERVYHLFDDNFKSEIPPEIILQHCKLQAALCQFEFHKFKNAISEFTSCLRQGQHYDPFVRDQCLKYIKQILEQEKLLDKAPGLMKLIQNNFEKKWKDIVIVVDFSSSMQSTIDVPKKTNIDSDKRKPEYDQVTQKDVAVQKFLEIFDDFVQNNDRVAFIRFNENVNVIFELNEKGNNTRFLRNSIESQFGVQAVGESAVRQAIYTALKLFQKTVPKDHTKWVVVFTDGGDSCSKISEPGLMKILGESDINIMIIGCGLDKYATKIFRQFCEKTKNGIFIKTNNRITEIDIAFQAITNKLYGNSDLNYNVEAFL